MRRAWIALAVAIALLVLLFAWIGPTPVSDRFVSFQYARHLAGGDGLVLSAGDAPSEGYSGLLWVLVCAAVFAAGGEAPAAAPYLSLAFAVIAVVLLWVLLRRRSESTLQLVVPLLFVVTSAPFVVSACSLTDTSLFAALLVAGVLALDAAVRNPGALRVGVLVAVMALTIVCRFEGLVAVLVAALVLLRVAGEGSNGRSARSAHIAAVVLAAVAVAFHAWRAVTFGAFIPDALRIAAGANVALLRTLPPYEPEPYGLYYIAVAVLSWFAWRRSSHHPADRHALMTAASLGALYLFVRDPSPAQLNHAALIGIAVVTWPRLVAVLETAIADGSNRPIVRWLVLGAVAMLALGAVADQRITAGRYRNAYVDTYRPVGEWIHTYYPDARIATDEPGPLTYYAAAPTTDLRRRSRIGRQAPTPLAAVARARPEFVVLGSNGLLDFAVSPHLNPLVNALRTSYRAFASVRTTWSHDRCIILCIRADLPHLTQAQADAFPEGFGPVSRFNP